jgi:hypothetical protein
MMLLDFLQIFSSIYLLNVPCIFINKFVNTDYSVILNRTFFYLMSVCKANGASKRIIAAKRIETDYIKTLFSMQSAFVA